MTQGVPILWPEKERVQAVSNGSKPFLHPRLPVKRAEVQGHKSPDRLTQHNALRVVGPGQAVCALRDHPLATDMSDMQDKVVIQLEPLQFLNQVE